MKKEANFNPEFMVFDLIHDLKGNNRRQKFILDEVVKSLMEEKAPNPSVLEDMRKNVEKMVRLWDILESSYLITRSKQ